MKETTVRTCRIFLYSIWSSFAHIPTSGILADGNRELRGSIVILKVPDLLWSNYMPSFKKKKFFTLGMSFHVPNCNHLWRITYSIYTCEFPNLPICFYGPQENFLVYTLNTQPTKTNQSNSEASQTIPKQPQWPKTTRIAQPSTIKCHPKEPSKKVQNSAK